MKITKLLNMTRSHILRKGKCSSCKFCEQYETCDKDYRDCEYIKTEIES